MKGILEETLEGISGKLHITLSNENLLKGFREDLWQIPTETPQRMQKKI